MMCNHDDLFGKPVFHYTRAQAIDDGELVDVSVTAKEAGFSVPVAVTRSVWYQYIEWLKIDTDNQCYQDQAGRLWDVLWMLNLACRRSNGESSLIYSLNVIPRDGSARNATSVSLKSVIGGGDEGEPVITIMLPQED